MSDFASGLNAALKYATAPAQGIGSFIRAAEGQPVHFSNPHDRVLQDYLDEHNDGRAEIVRRHLSRSEGAAERPVMDDLRRVLGPTEALDMTDRHTLAGPDGLMHFEHWEHPDTGQRAVVTSWHVHHPDDTGLNIRNNAGRVYRAVLSPAEAMQMVKGLNVTDPTETGMKPPVEVS